MKAIILAAGKGTRLKALTEHRPKPMLPIGKMPLLEHHIRWLRHYMITDIAINLHHAPEVITRYFGDGRNWDVSIYYSHEPTLLGTAGAAKRAAQFLTGTFVVIYGDVFTNLRLDRLLRFHHAQVAEQGRRQSISLALYHVPNPTECGLVELDLDDRADNQTEGRIKRFVEKPPAEQVFTTLANTGIMVCEAEALAAIPPDLPFDFGLDLFPKLQAAQVPLFGQEIAPDEFVIDIGTPTGYQRAQETWTRATLPMPGA